MKTPTELLELAARAPSAPSALSQQLFLARVWALAANEKSVARKIGALALAEQWGHVPSGSVEAFKAQPEVRRVIEAQRRKRLDRFAAAMAADADR